MASNRKVKDVEDMFKVLEENVYEKVYLSVGIMYIKFKKLKENVYEKTFPEGQSAVIIYKVFTPLSDFDVVAYNDGRNVSIWGADTNIIYALEDAIEKWDKLAHDEKKKEENPFRKVLLQLKNGGE